MAASPPGSAQVNSCKEDELQERVVNEFHDCQLTRLGTSTTNSNSLHPHICGPIGNVQKSTKSKNLKFSFLISTKRILRKTYTNPVAVGYLVPFSASRADITSISRRVTIRTKDSGLGRIRVLVVDSRTYSESLFLHRDQVDSRK
jgi:hypothetical protein